MGVGAMGAMKGMEGMADGLARGVGSAGGTTGLSDTSELSRCQVLESQFDVKGAEACFKSLISASPSDAEALASFGYFLATTGGFPRLAEAQSLLERAIAIAPRNPQARIWACNVIRERGSVEEAERCLVDAATELNHETAYNNLGVVR